MKLILTLVALSLAQLLFSQTKVDSNIKWSENYDDLNLMCELVVDDQGVLTKVFYEPGFLRIQKVNEENKVLKDKTFEFGMVAKGGSVEAVFKTYNYYNFISRYRIKKENRYVYRLTQINITTLEIETENEELFSHKNLKNRSAQNFFLRVSENERNFFIGYNKLTDSQGDIYDYAYTLVVNVYNGKGDKINSGEYVFEDQGERIILNKSFAQITNQGCVVIRHDLKNKILHLPILSKKIVESKIQDLILGVEPYFVEINNITALNGGKNVVSVSYSDNQEDRFQTGIVIYEITSSGDCKLLNHFRIPNKLTKTISNTKYEESKDCIRKTHSKELQLFNWKISEFEVLDDSYVLFLEYNLIDEGSIYERMFSPAHFGSRIPVFRDGELVVFKFDSDFSEFQYHIIPKLFAGECDESNCVGLQSTFNIAGYSMFNENSKIMLFFWANSNNEKYMNGVTEGERNIHHVPTHYREKMCMYSVELNNEQDDPKYTNLGSFMSSDYSALLNHGVYDNGNIFFRAHRRSSATGRFKIAKFPF